MHFHHLNRNAGQSRRLALLTLTAGLLGLGMTACSAPQNRGAAKSYRIESRMPDEGGRPGSADLVVATEEAVEGIASVESIRKNEGKTVVVLDRVENRTSDPSARFQIYLARIRALLNQSGAKQDISFVETRNKAEEIKAREGVASERTGRLAPKYALSGTFYDLPRGGTNFYLLTFQLVDLRNDVIEWEGSYEVKL